MTDAFREPLGNDQHQITSLMTSWTSTTTTTTQPHPTRRRRGDVGQVDQNKTLIMNSNYSTTTTTKPQTQQQLPTDKTTCNRLRMSTKERTTRRRSPLAASYPTSPLVLVCLAALCLSASLQLGQADDSATRQQQQIDLRSTQPTLDRQLETPSSSSSGAGAGAAALAQAIPSPASSSPASVKPPTSSSETNRQHEQPRKLQKPIPSLASQKKAAALAAQRDYDKYQLKASSSSASSAAAAAAAPKVAASDSSSAAQSKPSSGQEKANGNNNGQTNNNKQAPEGSSSSTSAATQTLEPAHKKIGQLPNTRQPPKASASFSLLKKFFPSFMTSAAAVAATASAAAATSVDKQPHHNQHSRSSPTTSNSLLSSLLSSSSSGRSSSASDGSASASPSFALTGKIINLLSGALKKKGLPEGVSSAIPNHAPFFMRKSAVDRQAAGGGALALASGLLSNPLKLGLLFSAPLLPSLLLTPLAIAGLSPAMSAINNFFGDDDEPSSSSQSPLAALASGSSSPLASILQATGASPFSSASSSSSSSDSSSSGSSSSSPGNSLALQAFQSFLGPTSTTERPLFNPGMFASSGIQNAAGAIGSALSAAAGSQSGGASSSSSGSFASSSNQRPSFFGSGGGLIQTAASMISPSFAAPPSSSGSSSNNANNNNNDDDGPGLMQMASGVFEKVANYMGNDGKDSNSIGQASGGSSATNSPLSTLASLSSMSPFQLSSLFASTPLGSAMGSPHVHSGSGSSSSSSGPIGNSNQRAGFFSTLRNIYELFSSSFLRRQEVGNENECQQRLICELHQRAMNSKLFRRSLQSNLAELANLDKNLIEQLKYSSQALQARVDPDTKAMLSDFLKATNNFKSGREMINCSQMFPKCSRTQLLAAANAHLSDPVNGRAIGKFSQLMKKMKFKSNQQHQSQWKLRKPGKSANVAGAQMAQAMRISPSLGVMQPATDYLQVAPLAPTAGAAQMAPVDSLKLAQQIMMMSQMNQQQQQPQAQASASSPAVAVSQYAPNGVISQQQQYRQSSSQQVPASYQPSAGMPQSSSYPSANSYISQYSPASKQQTTYTDAMVPTVQYSPTESPYFMQQPQASGSVGGAHQQQQQQQYLSSLGDQQQQQQSSYVGQQAQSQPMITNSQQQSAGQQQVASYPSDPSMPQQQQAGQNLDNKNKMQQLLTPGNSNASRPATAATAA